MAGGNQRGPNPSLPRQNVIPTTFYCYLCGTELEMKDSIGWCPRDKFWVDKPWEKRFSPMPELGEDSK